MVYLLFDNPRDSGRGSFISRLSSMEMREVFSPRRKRLILGWWKGARDVVRLSRKDDTVVCWYDFQAVLCFLLCKLLGKRRKIVCINLLLKDKTSLKNRLVAQLYALALRSKNFVASVTSVEYGEHLKQRLGFTRPLFLVHDVYHDSYQNGGAMIIPNTVFCATSLLTKYKSGGVTHAHFSDVLRFELLREHGGVWIDATCFISQAFPSYVYEHSFFSLNGAYDGGLGWKWTSWFMAAKKGNLLVENMCRFYEAYWKKYDSAVTYLFLDCWVLALYNHIPEIKAEIDSLPICGKCFSIISKWGHIYSEDLMDDITSQYFVNKLTYKAPLPNERVGEHLTIFGKLIEKFK